MKKKKIINIRKSIVTGAVALATLVTIGLGLYKNNSRDDSYLPSEDPSNSEFISESPSVSESPIIEIINPQPSDSKGEEIKDPDVTPSHGEETPNPSESLNPIESANPTTKPSPSVKPSTKPSERPTITSKPGESQTTDDNIHPIWPSDPVYPTLNPSDKPSTSPSPSDKPSASPSPSDKPSASPSPSDKPNPSKTPEPSETPEHKHSWSEWMIIKNPSCTEDGLKRKTCSCGEVEEEKIPATGHELTEEITKKPTCTENGIKTISCIKDDYTKTEDIPALGHKYGDIVWGNWKVVTENGEKVEKRTGTQTCKNDKSHVNIVTETRPYTPPVIEEPDTPEHTHNWGEWVITKEPTCTDVGEKTRRCLASGCTVLTEQQEIPALGHTVVTDKRVEPTCTTDGKTEGSHCSVCNTVIIAQQTIPAKGHTVVIDERVEPTCTTDGKTEGSHCSVCNTEIIAQEVIPALGHDFETEFTIDKEATCAEDGSKSKHCTRCDARTEETIIPKGEHVWSEWIIAKEATCTEAGERTRTCSVCQHLEKETISAKGHTEKADSRNKEYTNDANSYCYQEYYICKDCGNNIYFGEHVPHNFTGGYDPDTGMTHCSGCKKEYIGNLTSSSTYTQDATEPPKTEVTETTSSITTGDIPPVELALDKIIKDQASARNEVTLKAEAQLAEIISSDVDDNLKDEVIGWLIEDVDNAYNVIDLQAEEALNNLINGEGSNLDSPMILTRTK